MPEVKKFGAEAYEEIRSRKQFLKICVKTKNEGPLLQNWIAHHAKAVEMGALLIADNNSDRAQTHDIYSSLDPEIGIYSFDGFHNNIQNYAIHHEFIDALRASCDYYAILDTDELLFALDRVSFKLTPAILVDVLATYGAQVFPATWLHNSRIGSLRHFHIGYHRKVLDDGLLWGKPIISSSASIEGLFLHNAHIPKEYFSPNLHRLLFLGHLTKYDPVARIRTNLEKMAARGLTIINPDADVGEVYAAVKNYDLDQDPAGVSRWIEDIKRLTEIIDHRSISDIGSSVSSGEVVIDDDGRMQFYDSNNERYFRNFVFHDDSARRFISQPKVSV